MLYMVVLIFAAVSILFPAGRSIGTVPAIRFNTRIVPMNVRECNLHHHKVWIPTVTSGNTPDIRCTHRTLSAERSKMYVSENFVTLPQTSVKQLHRWVLAGSKYEV